MITRAATELFQRVAELTLREIIIAFGILGLIGAIAWIGRNVSRLIEAHAALVARVRDSEALITRVDDAVAKRCKNLESRQDRLQAKMENLGKDWRDSMRRTEERPSGEFDLTKFDLRKPE